MISKSRYQELTKLEDILYGKAAEIAIEQGLADDKEVEELFDKI